jgi:AcrR family transcriptional regulator
MFVRDGYRRASVDRIAVAAGVAKPTLYAHFGSKEALFCAVCARLGEQIVAEAEAAAGADASLDERLALVLFAKFGRVFDLLNASPHAVELLNPPSAGAREQIARSNEAFRAVLIRVLGPAAGEPGPASAAGLDTGAFAERLMQIGHGAGYGAASADDLKDSLRSLIRLVVRSG